MTFDMNQPLKTKKDFEEEAQKQTKTLKGRQLSLDVKGMIYDVEIEGVRVVDIGGKKGKFLGVDVKGEVTRPNGKKRKIKRVNDPMTSRRLYTLSSGLPDDVLVGGEMEAFKVPKGANGLFTSSGMITTPGQATKVNLQLGKQAQDFKTVEPANG